MSGIAPLIAKWRMKQLSHQCRINQTNPSCYGMCDDQQGELREGQTGRFRDGVLKPAIAGSQ
jgi:hypothetical protein